MTSILNGVKSILAQLHGKNDGELIDEAYACICKNWNKKPTKSRKNWALRFVPMPDDSIKKEGHGAKSEVPLERAIAYAFKEKGVLWNQMPVASGLVENSDKDRRRAIDLIYKPDSPTENYEFIELKVANNKINTPKDAAIEIIEYGLLYLFSREHMGAIGYSADKQPILGASFIGLRVLAEDAYYKSWMGDDYYNFNNFNESLNNYIESNPKRFGELKMDFKFESFHSNFESPEIVGTKFDEKLIEYLRNAISTKATYPKKSI